MNGFIVVYKPKGVTSSDIVVKARRLLGVKKIGHLGTLDPAATGVLPLALGLGTRLFDYLIEKKKNYRAGFVFGRTTDTLDSEGVVTDEMPCNFTEEDIAAATQELTGEISQIPPAYSSKSVGGVRSYVLARQGTPVELAPKKITVYDFSYKGAENGIYNFDITCSGGTYIRALARDMAEKLGTVGYMASLERTVSGIFSLENAVTLEELSAAKTAGREGELLIPLTAAISEMPIFRVPDSGYERLTHGVKMEFQGLPERGYFTVFCRGELFGIGVKDEKGRLELKTFLRENI